MLLLSALALPVLAGNVYRCDAGDGITSYSNKRVAGASCKLVGSYKAQRAAKPKPRPAASVVAAESVPAYEPVTVPKGMAMGVAPATIISLPAKARTTAVAPTPAPRYDAPRLVRGQVYAYVGKDGVRNYTSVRPRGVSASAMRTIKYSYMETCYACGAKPGLNFGTLRLNTAAYQAEIAAAAREVGVSDAFDPVQNIGGGVRYLAMLLKRFNGNLTLAAAGYNAGEGAVDRHGGVPPYQETQRYVARVGVLADRYRGAVGAH